MKWWNRLSGELRAICAAIRFGVGFWQDIRPCQRCPKCKFWYMRGVIWVSGTCKYCAAWDADQAGGMLIH